MSWNDNGHIVSQMEENFPALVWKKSMHSWFLIPSIYGDRRKTYDIEAFHRSNWIICY